MEEDIKTFTGGYAQNDDITVVAIKEKLGADDVLAGLRRQVIDLVEVQGMSVKDACAKMKMSPTTYYRYRKRLAAMGERGLKNKVLRAEVDLKMMTVEENKAVMRIIARYPEWGAKRISDQYNGGVARGRRELTARLIYDELRRLGLNTKELRVTHVRRSGLLEEEPLLKDS